MGHVQTSRVIPTDPATLYALVADLQNVPEQMRGRLEIEFPSGTPIVQPLTEFEAVLTRFHITARVVVRVEVADPGKRLSYRQLSGAFSEWWHLTMFEEHGPRQTLMTDIVDFSVPGGLLGSILDDLVICGEVKRLLNHRSLKIAERFGGSRDE